MTYRDISCPCPPRSRSRDALRETLCLTRSNQTFTHNFLLRLTQLVASFTVCQQGLAIIAFGIDGTIYSVVFVWGFAFYTTSSHILKSPHVRACIARCFRSWIAFNLLFESRFLIIFCLCKLTVLLLCCWFITTN
jgi:hypothetical protein